LRLKVFERIVLRKKVKRIVRENLILLEKEILGKLKKKRRITIKRNFRLKRNRDNRILAVWGNGTLLVGIAFPLKTKKRKIRFRRTERDKFGL